MIPKAFSPLGRVGIIFDIELPTAEPAQLIAFGRYPAKRKLLKNAFNCSYV